MSNFYTVTGVKENGTGYLVLTDANFEEISPRVRTIKYDEEKDMYLFSDKLNITEYVTGTLYYYVDGSGKLYNFGFIDLFDGLIDMEYSTVQELSKHYQEFKFKLGNHFRPILDNKKNHNIEVIKKLTLKK